MEYKASSIIKVITVIYIVGALLIIGNVSKAHARIFYVNTVAEIQAALDDAATNGVGDAIIMGPGVYEINSAYTTMPCHLKRTSDSSSVAWEPFISPLSGAERMATTVDFCLLSAIMVVI